MMFCDFETMTHGKWVLAGEHAVLRGHGALAFPIQEKKLILRYDASQELSATFEGTSSDELHLLFWSVLQHGLQLCGQSLNRLKGHFHLESNISIGVGLGASAALCVAVSRWFAEQQFIPADTIFCFARTLENLFHGKSSGLDIAAVSSKKGIFYQQGEITPLEPAWQPTWYLSSSGQVGITSQCIQQVNALWTRNRAIAAQIDVKMQSAVTASLKALESPKFNSLHALQAAIECGADCFKAWGLVNNPLSQHMQQLKSLGALAVKPTGSGNGGYVLSLWDRPPSALTLTFDAISL